MTPEDHNDLVDRASIIVGIGILSLVAVLILLVVMFLFFDTSSQEFTLTIIVMIVVTIFAVIAIFFATGSILGANILRFSALFAAFGLGVIALVEFRDFINAFRIIPEGSTSTEILVNIGRTTFAFLYSLLFFGFMIAYIVTAGHYVHSLQRRDAIKTEEIVTEGDVETPSEPYPAITSNTTKQRANFGVKLKD